MKRMVSVLLSLFMLLTNVPFFSVFAADTQTVSVPLTVTAAYQKDGSLVIDQDWRDNATYTYTVTDGVPSDSGTLSNGKYSFLYTPASGRLAGFSFAEGVSTDMPVVVPRTAGAIRLSDGAVYPETEMDLYVSEIKYAPFYQKSVQHIILSEGVTTLAANAIRQPAKGFLTLQLPSTLKTIGNNAFYQNSNGGLSSVHIPEGVTSLGSGVFVNANITEITLPKGVTEIKADTFKACDGLQRVVFEGEVTSIGTNAFQNNFALSEMVFMGNTAPGAVQPIGASASTLTVYYPAMGTGYMSPDFQEKFPSGTQFVPMVTTPSAEGVTVSGNPVIGQTLVGDYGGFSDPFGRSEGDSYCVWSTADDPDFTAGVAERKREEIKAGGSSLFSPGEEDLERYIRFSVTPVAEGGKNNVGETVFADMAEPVRIARRIPTVRLTSHQNGDNVQPNQPVTLTCDAFCDGAEITKVEYFVDGQPVGQAENAPYAVTWIPQKTGAFEVTARAYNHFDETGESVPCRLYVSPVTELRLLGQNGTAEIKNLLYGNTQVTARGLLQNTGDAPQKTNLLIGAYDGEGALLNVCSSEAFTIPAQTVDYPADVTLPLSQTLIDHTREIRVFVWDLENNRVLGKTLCRPIRPADDFDILRLKWKDMLTGGENADQSQHEIREKIQSINKDAQAFWEDMNHEEDRNFIFYSCQKVKGNEGGILATFERLKTMALAHETVGAALYQNAEMCRDIIDALEWMNQNAYSAQIGWSGNWWHWQIGAPQELIDTAVLLYDFLEQDQLGRYMAAVGRYQNDIAMTGANRMWECKVFAGRGILIKDAELLSMVPDGMSDIFAMVTKDDGFYQDGSFLQHHTIAYNGGYGLSLIDCMADVMYVLSGSPWEIREVAGSNVFRWILDGYEMFVYQGALMDLVRGREISRPGTSTYNAGHQLMSAILRLSQFAPEKYAKEFKSMVKYWILSNPTYSYYPDAPIDRIMLALDIVGDDSIPSRGEQVKYHQFYSMDRAVQLRPGYGLALSMHSSRVANYESINSENGSGYHTGDGMLYLYNGDFDQYSGSFWPTVNRCRLPGTTVLKDSKVDPNKTGTEDWVGGTELEGLYGVSGMELHPYGQNLNARKSWFFFDDEVAALGAGITSTDGVETETIVENRKLSPENTNRFLADGQEKPTQFGWTEEMRDVRWAHLGGSTAGADIGYYFPDGEDLLALREQRQGKWSSINSGSSSAVYTDNYLTLWLNHGKNPQNADYAYALLPGKTPEETQAYAGNPDIEVLENTPDVQAVQDTRRNLLGANFWEDGRQTAGIITCDKKASVMLHRTEEQISLALSDPTQKNQGTIELEIAAPATGVLVQDSRMTVRQLSPTIQLRVDVSGLAGASLSAVFALKETAVLEPAPDTYLIDNTDAGFSTDPTPWPSAVQRTGYYGGDYLTDGTSGADQDRWAKWTPDIQKADVYDVYIRFPAAGDAPAKVPVEVQYAGGTDVQKILNQRKNSGVWLYIGSYPFKEGDGGYVKISASSQGKTTADAVKFTAQNQKGNTRRLPGQRLREPWDIKN